MTSGPITSWEIDGETVETVADFILGGSKITADGAWSHEIKRHLLLGRKVIQKQRHYFANKGPSSQGYGFYRSHVCMWELDCEESWALKNWCFWTVVLEKTLESPLDCKEIQPVHSKGDQSWVFFGRNDAKAETPVLWPPHEKNWLIGKDWCWEGLGAGGEGDNREWDGWMASPTWWRWVWVNSGSWWWTGRPGVAKSQTWLSNWTELNWSHRMSLGAYLSLKFSTRVWVG